MRRIIMICFAIMVAASMTVSVLASTGGFVSSPSRNPAPEVVEGKNTSKDCESKLIITAYGDRDELTEESRVKIEEAYADIVQAQDLSSLNSAIKKVANNMGLEVSELAVSELFDISATNCQGHGDHGRFDITLKPETLKNFVCLLHYCNGEWHVVDNAEVTHNGDHLEFDVDQLSPFAIVVSTGKAPVPPAIEVSAAPIIAAVATAAAVGAGVFFTFKFEKKGF